MCIRDSLMLRKSLHPRMSWGKRELNSYGVRAVSYTHLDVYKRQGYAFVIAKIGKGLILKFPFFWQIRVLVLVSELTSEILLAALRRFTSRSGKCANIFSDNGINFVGASEDLPELFYMLKQKYKKRVTCINIYVSIRIRKCF